MSTLIILLYSRLKYDYNLYFNSYSEIGWVIRNIYFVNVDESLGIVKGNRQ